VKTPEGYVKADVDKYLKSLGAYVFAPVQQGFGQQTLDRLCCIFGKFVAIEIKAPGNKPTPRQYAIIEQIQRKDGIAFWVSSVEDLKKSLEFYHVR